MTLTSDTVIAACVAQIRKALGTLEATIQQDTARSVFLVSKYQDAVEAIRDALASMQCETCSAVATVTVGEMYLCVECASGWEFCQRCLDPVKHADAVFEDTRVASIVRGGMGFGWRVEQRPYHAPCSSGVVSPMPEGPDGVR